MSIERIGPLPVVSRSSHEVVVIKPSGMATEMAADLRGESLIEIVRTELNEPNAQLPHRLDKVTRGIVLVALSREALVYYNEEIHKRRWGKYYVARIARPNGRNDLVGEHRAYLKRRGRRAETVHAGGKPSFLEILQIESAPEHAEEAHALIRLTTGRYHQIRVMLADLGYPLIGDARYGGRSGAFYLEHVLLRYNKYADQDNLSAWLEADPERENISWSIIKQIKVMAELQGNM